MDTREGSLKGGGGVAADVELMEPSVNDEPGQGSSRE